jgi:uncharacterized membrane protein
MGNKLNQNDRMDFIKTCKLKILTMQFVVFIYFCPKKMKKLLSYLVQGLLYTAPIAITAYIIVITFSFVDGLLIRIIGEMLGIEIPGLGILVIVFSLIAIGYLGQTIIANPLKSLVRRVMERAPLLKVIYSAINDLFSAFVGKEKKFNRPVLVLVNPISNLHKLGFLTEDDLSVIDETDKVAVYFPHSYNFSGELFIVPREYIKPLDLNPGEVMKFIVSAGVSGWNGSHQKTANGNIHPLEIHTN